MKNTIKYQNEEKITQEEYNLIMTIIKLRLKNKITQKKLSELTGISQPNITRFEKNTHSASLKTTLKILNALGYTLKISKL